MSEELKDLGFHACFYCANSHQFRPNCTEKCKCACHESEPPEIAAKNEEWRKYAVDEIARELMGAGAGVEERR